MNLPIPNISLARTAVTLATLAALAVPTLAAASPKNTNPGLDPAIATAIAAHQDRNTASDQDQPRDDWYNYPTSLQNQVKPVTSDPGLDHAIATAIATHRSTSKGINRPLTGSPCQPYGHPPSLHPTAYCVLAAAIATHHSRNTASDQNQPRDDWYNYLTRPGRSSAGDQNQPRDDWYNYLTSLQTQVKPVSTDYGLDPAIATAIADHQQAAVRSVTTEPVLDLPVATAIATAFAAHHR
jgi:hypothetical protein